MGNKKMVGILIIVCLIITVILMVVINSMKQNGEDNTIKEQGKRQYIEENIIIKDKYEYNEFAYNNISTEQLLRAYLSDYKNKCLDNPENTYELLDKEYREKKFETLESYIQYINNNREEILGAKIDKFTVNNYDTFKEYIIQDQFGNYYIFNVTAVMDYTIILDNYTIASESFKQEYNEAENEEKAAMNLNRFLEAIENKDYKYAYSKIYNTFKNNNFPTQADFENYINQNWLNYNHIETVNIENQNGVYACKLTILSENNEKTERTFMIQLGKGTEYLISFTI